MSALWRDFHHRETHLKVDTYFEIFAAQQALKMRRFNPDPVEIESGIVGGAGDDRPDLLVQEK